MDQLNGVRGSIALKDLIQVQIPATLSPADVISIFQVLFINQVAFMDGTSILESTHNFLYVWEESWKYALDQNSKLGNLLVIFGKSLHFSLGSMHGAMIDGDIYDG